jgi:ABC-type multidrug transport system fused ATPase/permease subunit
MLVIVTIIVVFSGTYSVMASRQGRELERAAAATLQLSQDLAEALETNAFLRRHEREAESERLQGVMANVKARVVRETQLLAVVDELQQRLADTGEHAQHHLATLHQMQLHWSHRAQAEILKRLVYSEHIKHA